MLDEDSEITIEEAKKLDPDVELEDEVGVEVSATLGRIQANIAKQAIMEVIKNAEAMKAFSANKDKKGRVVSTVVQTVHKKGVLVILGSTEVEVPKSELVLKEALHRGQHLDMYVKDISINENGKLNIALSRAHPMLVYAIMKEEVSDIDEGIIEILAVAREPGQKTKVVVDSDDTSVKSVAACIGFKGERIQRVMQRMGGERVDVVQYSDDEKTFLKNLLSSVDLKSVEVLDNEFKVDVLNKQDLAKAIGREGVNVKLASKITGKKITVA